MKNIDEQQIVFLYKEKELSTPSLGDMFEVSYNTIRRVLQRNGVPLRKSWAKKERKCGHCKEIFPITDFYRTRDYICKKCQSEYNHKHPRLKSRYAKYGITPEKYFILLEKQNGRCLICKNVSERRLAVDHDRVTGKIRGLLCTNCNLGIGFFRDSPILLESAAKYLREE
jgi:hypothetical protein